jgi:hypothetical protein
MNLSFYFIVAIITLTGMDDFAAAESYKYAVNNGIIAINDDLRNVPESQRIQMQKDQDRQQDNNTHVDKGRMHESNTPSMSQKQSNDFIRDQTLICSDFISKSSKATFPLNGLEGTVLMFTACSQQEIVLNLSSTEKAHLKDLAVKIMNAKKGLSQKELYGLKAKEDLVNNNWENLKNASHGNKDSILNHEIIDGKSMLGINIGDVESEIYKIAGSPDEIQTHFLDIPPETGKLKALIYMLDEHTNFIIFTRNGKVDAIEVFWSGEGIPIYKGKTTRGIGLGNSMADVKKNYGECDMNKELCWYNKYGIAVESEKVVTIILIASPGKLPFYLLTKQPYL